MFAKNNWATELIEVFKLASWRNETKSFDEI